MLRISVGKLDGPAEPGQERSAEDDAIDEFLDAMNSGQRVSAREAFKRAMRICLMREEERRY